MRKKIKIKIKWEKKNDRSLAKSYVGLGHAQFV